MLLHLLRHSGAASGAEVSDVEQYGEDDSIHHVRISPLSICACELVLDVNVFDVDFGVQVDCGFGTRPSFVGRLPLMNHRDHRFIVSKNVKHGAITRRFHV